MTAYKLFIILININKFLNGSLHISIQYFKRTSVGL